MLTTIRSWSSARRAVWLRPALAGRLLLLLFACGVLLRGRATAQALQPSLPGYGHTVWTTRDGLPQNMVRTVVQTRDGYLWIGTSNGGLVRFDGVAFTVFNVANTPALPSNWVAVLHEDAAGTLWIGTGAGLVRYADGTFTRDPFEDDPAHTSVSGIETDREGRLWVSSEGHVARRDGAGWTKRTVGGASVICLLPDRNGTTWIGTTNGLIEWRNGSIVKTLTVADGLPGDYVRALHVDAKGELWIGTRRGLARLDRARGTAHALPAPLGTASIHAIFEDRDGLLWIGAVSRLYARTRTGDLTEHVIADVAEVAQVSALTEDREGHLWFGVEGGRGGLHRLRRHPVAVLNHESGLNHESRLAKQQGLPCDNIGPVTQGPDGTVWAGLFCMGGHVAAIRDGRVVAVHAEPSHVSALLADADGAIWAGDFDGKLFRLDHGRFTPQAIGVAGPPAPILALHRDAQGALWLGTSKGLLRQKDGQWQKFGTADGLAHDDVRSITPGRAGALWIGLGEGLALYDHGKFTAYATAQGLPRAPVRAVHVDSANTVWIGTYGGGLCRLKGGKIVCLGTQGGLLDTSVHRLIEDDAGFLWMSGDRGIRRASRRDLEEVVDGRRTPLSVVVYDDADGMTSAEANGMGQPAGWKMRDGSLWFPTQGGLARLDPARVTRESPAPHVRIEQVVVNGRDYDPLRPVSAPTGSTELEVHYTAPVFTRPEQVHFKYRLAGHDEDWVEAGPRRVAYYTNLAPGRYRFEVAARSSAGQWSKPAGSQPAGSQPAGSQPAGSESAGSGAAETVAGGTVAVVLQPRWYQQTSVTVGLVIVGLVAALGLVRLRDARLRQRARQLEAVVAERTTELCQEREGLNAANQELGAAKAALQTSHTQLLSVLDQLRVGVIIVNPRHEILFVSEATRRLLAGLDEDAVGRPIEQMLPIAPEALAELQTLLRDPRPGARLTVQLHLRSGQRCWSDLEVRLDPRDHSNSILYLYDVTETYEMKRVQESEAQGSANKALASLIGHSVVMRFVHGQIRTVAGVDATVLIEGETGTGKELVARAIHEASRRKDRPFVAINCAGLTESLLASQLFGHRRGAFTGAVMDHVGLFEAAQGGTLLLDEIGDMPMSVQTHLLRVMQEREILRLGESRPRRIDVRVLVATHRSLEQEVASGKFREDLLYRILVVRIALPPLRQRLDDIPLLATAFMQQFSAAHRKPLEGFSRDAMEKLMAQRWPGNVRELKAAIEWAVIRAAGPTIRRTDLPIDVVHADVPPSRGKMMDEERRRLVETLTRTGGNRSVAARLLGVSRATLYRRLAALELDEEQA